AEQHPIDVLKIVPSHLSALLMTTEAQKLLPRRALVLGGEALPMSLLERLEELGGRCKVYNHYGPTETTIGVLVNPLGVLSTVGTGFSRSFNGQQANEKPLSVPTHHAGSDRQPTVGTGVSLASNGQPENENPLSTPTHHALGRQVPLGRPINNIEIYVLDRW